MAVAAASRVSELELQPLLERRIPFHPARDLSSASGIAALPPGIEPLNRGFDAAAAAAPSANAAASADPPAEGKGTKRSWQEANERVRADEELMISPLKIGAGLTNLGNTCFLNSVLQCLTYTQPLANYLKTGQHKATCRHAGFCALCALESHVKVALQQSWNKPISPTNMVKNLRSICRAFQPWRQEDAHEYLRYLMEALQKSCLPIKTPLNSPEQEKSLLYRIFGGRLKSQVKCTECFQVSETVEPFWDLSLDITRADSLAKALARFTSNDILEGENKYNCLKCKRKVRAIKRFTIETAPNILTVQFKRFSGHHGQKIDKKVLFGRSLDLRPFMSNARDGAAYDLYGVLVHSGGSTHSGHYYCFVRTAGDMWHNLDDSRVKQLSEQIVMDQKAYILFYMRKPAAKLLQASQPSVVAAAGPNLPAASPSDKIPQAVKTPVADVSAKEKVLSEVAEVVPSIAPEAAANPETAAVDAVATAVTPEASTPAPTVAPPAQKQAVGVAAAYNETEALVRTDTSCKGTPPLPETASLAPPVSTPPAPPVAPPVAPTVAPSAAPPVAPPVTTRAALPVAPPVAPPVTTAAFPVTAPVAAPVAATYTGSSVGSSVPPPKTATPSVPSTETTPGKPCSPAETAPSEKMKIDSTEPADSDSSGGSSQRKRSIQRSKPESPRKVNRGCLKLLRAMPKSRRFFMARALEVEHGDIGLSKRRRLLDNESRQRTPTPTPEDSANRATPPPTKPVSEAANGGTSELFGSGVARWGGVDAKDIDRLLKAEHKTPARKLDEWDEEYDRGKVKKVRRVAVGGRLTPCKNNDGSQSSNPFQVLAGNKHKKV